MDDKYPKNLYKYMSAERGYQVLCTKKIRFNSPLLFNDPFDLARVYCSEYTSEQISNAIYKVLTTGILENRSYMNEIFKYNLKDDLKEYISEYQGANSKKHDELKSKLLKDEKISDKIKKLSTITPKSRNVWNNNLERTRILCLSNSINNMPLWCHYAKDYTGVAISFKSESGRLFDTKINTIKYKSKLFNQQLGFWVFFRLYKNINSLYTLQAIEKLSDWEYEQESRLVKIEKTTDFKGYLYKDIDVDFKDIDAIYLGYNINQVDKNKIISMARHLDISIYQQGLDNGISFQKL